MNKTMLIVFPLVLVLVGGGLAFTGVINIPGITPAKKKAAKKEEEKKPEAPKPAAKPIEPAPKPKSKSATVVTFDEDKGAKRLARLWNEMDVTALERIVKDWKDAELVKVLAKMDDAKVAELLTALDAKRASALSRGLQRDAAAVVQAET